MRVQTRVRSGAALRGRRAARPSHVPSGHRKRARCRSPGGAAMPAATLLLPGLSPSVTPVALAAGGVPRAVCVPGSGRGDPPRRPRHAVPSGAALGLGHRGRGSTVVA